MKDDSGMRSPHFTFGLLGRVHLRSNRTVEIPGEACHVGEGSLDPELVRRVGSGHHGELEGLGPGLGAPHVGSADPEHLLRREVQAGQSLLLTILGCPGVYKMSSAGCSVSGTRRYSL